MVKSPAPAAAGGSPRERRGTSATTTKTARSTRARSTANATGAPQRTESSAKEPKNTKNVGSQPGGPPDETVSGAVKRDLAAMAKRDPALASSTLAMSALVLAGQLDNPATHSTSKSMCAKALLDVVNRLLELSPPEQKRDGLDDLASRRAARRSGVAASSP